MSETPQRHGTFDRRKIVKRFVATLLTFIAALQFTTAADETLNLFDGKSLAGWEHYLVDPEVKMADVWSVDDGLLICQGEPMGYLATKKTFTNFRLIVEWRWAPGKPATNSGVLMRITGEPRALPRSVEAQLKSRSAGDIYGFHGFKVEGDEARSRTAEGEKIGKLSGVSKIKGNENEPGQWNRYDITLSGGDLTLVVNGEKVNEATGLDVVAGKIGLQSEGGEIHFRTVQLIPLAPPPADDAHSWPQFHGPARDNISHEKGLAKTWPDGGPPLLWTARGLGHGFSSVSIAGGIICTAGNIGDNTVVTALDMSGKELWRAVNGLAWRGSYPGSRSTPTIDGPRVYHQNPLGNIVCVDADTGKVTWEKDVLTAVRSKSTKWALAESLLIDGDRLISTPGGRETCMVALDKQTGEFIWKAPSVMELAGYSSPLLVEFDGLRIVVALTAKAIIGVGIEKGDLLWHVKHESYADENVLLPIHHDGEIFISTLQAGSVKWRIVKKDGKVGLEEVWRTKELDNHHGGVLLLDGYLYGTSLFKNRDKWVCVDWETGSKKYATKGVGKGSLTCADGMFYTLSIDRLMGLVKPSPEVFELVSAFEIPEGGEGKSWAHPVVCNGRLYVRHGEFLYVYNVGSGS